MNRHPIDRMAMSGEYGCSYDREVFFTPLHFGVGLPFSAD
jgi:hypothetical protein